MPQATRAGQQLMTWFAAGDQQSSDLSAQYLWTPQSLSDDLPAASPLDVRILKYRHVHDAGAARGRTTSSFGAGREQR